jgi:hypothetical protein
MKEAISRPAKVPPRYGLLPLSPNEETRVQKVSEEARRKQRLLQVRLDGKAIETNKPIVIENCCGFLADSAAGEGKCSAH